MTALRRCGMCGGFVPERLAQCPHCHRSAPEPSSRLARVGKACLKVATGGAVAMTLMACYGGPPRAYYGDMTPPPPPPDPCSGPEAAGDPKCAASDPAQQPAGPGQQQYAQPPPAAPVLAR